MSDIRLFPLPQAVPRSPEVEAWLNEPGELRALARKWFERLRACGPDVRETLHDGAPTACVGQAAFAYVNTFSAHVNLGFFPGSALRDPKRLLEGTGKFMRHVKIHPGTPIDETAIQVLIEAAYLMTMESVDRAPGPDRKE